MTSVPRLFSAIAAGLLLCPAAAMACTVTVTPLAFGSIDPVARMPTESTGTLVVSCPTQTSYTLSIDGGNGTVGDRFMTGAADTLRYQLYTDASLSLVWGDGTAGTVTVAGSAGPADTTHVVYGRVPAQPLAKAGAYTDTLTVTVTF